MNRELAVMSCKIVVIIGAMILLVIKVPDWTYQIKRNIEFKAKMDRWDKYGISPITRGGYVTYPDTTKRDTIKSNVK